MRKLWALLSRSPFGPAQQHMDAVLETAEMVRPLIAALVAGDQDEIRALARRTSQLERKADDVKNDIRNHLPRSLFLPVDRGDLLRLLSTQDAIADCAEDVGVLLTLRPMDVPGWLAEPLERFVDKVLGTVRLAHHIVRELDVLVEASFGGAEAERVLDLIRQIDRSEHEADKLQDQLARLIFAHEDELKPVAVFMWGKILNKIGDLANHAENVGDRIRMFLARA